MTRTDLLALTPDSLAALANRGLVKRAAKDLDAGNMPELGVEGDGSVRGTFPDGVQTVLPGGGGLEGASCTCAAMGVCRHQIGLVLAYQRQPGTEEGPAEDASAQNGAAQDARAEPQAEAAPEEPAAAGSKQQRPPFTDWSPGGYDDEALARVLGERPLTAARRTFRSGYAARVHRPTPADPVASVELPTCTVRFLVPHEFGYVHTDAVATMRGEVIVLAVWAFRAADEQGLTAADVRVDVGGKGRGTGKGTGGADAGTGLESTLDLLDQLLLDGAMHAGPVLGTALNRASRELTAKNLHWPAATLDDIAGQLTAYRDRLAGHDPERLAALLAEFHARHRAVLHEGGSPRSQVLGTNETAETPLRRVRLTALGCRVGGTDEERTADVFLAHTGSGIVLVLKRRWAVTDDQPLTGQELAPRRIAGAALRSLAAANVVSENATRSPSRVVRLGTGRVSKTSVTPVGTAWGDLPGTVLVRDLRALERELEASPPRLVRPRVEAETVRVLEIAEVRDVGYLPGAQRLEAVFRDGTGTTAVVSAAYAPHSPAALDELAAALAGERGAPLYVSGSVRRARGTLVVDPIAVMTTEGVVVPDLAPGDGSGALDAHAGHGDDALTTALAGALDACADAAHRGLRHVPAGTRARIGRSAAELRRTGLTATALLLDGLAAALDGDDPRRTVTAWVDAQIRLVTAMDLR
ncbi:hypothetical protein [Actinomadura rugatobispora]|uniref:SWIM-type domain-containing protein n=1 Tax=Actinomadura rugatobispora TaxID=1994 RepID=A0ABW1ACW7_9ACTN|nr:hypothetical protein GCM10010200_005420 [Actinomadura rugatobispora]